MRTHIRNLILSSKPSELNGTMVRVDISGLLIERYGRFLVDFFTEIQLGSVKMSSEVGSKGRCQILYGIRKDAGRVCMVWPSGRKELYFLLWVIMYFLSAGGGSAHRD